MGTGELWLAGVHAHDDPDEHGPPRHDLRAFGLPGRLQGHRHVDSIEGQHVLFRSVRDFAAWGALRLSPAQVGSADTDATGSILVSRCQDDQTT